MVRNYHQRLTSGSSAGLAMETLMSCFVIGISLLSVHCGCDASHVPRVTVTEGIIEGKTITRPGLVYNSFQGIPYAKPPIGKRRFKRPKPAEPWQGILNATQVGSACPQFDQLYLNEYYGEEDCLFLNVYVPIKKSHPPLPVLVNIHAGGFVVGDGGPLIYGPEYILKDDIIVVTFNYRLGALGFLSLNTPEVPGNAGLKDQSLALRWVKKNIAKFGGDENKISLVGQGSGAASVMYHILSPLSKGLFSRAILHAGSALDPWALQKHPKSNAQKLAHILGIGNRTDIAAFLKSIPDKDIVLAAQSELFDDPVKLPFVPTIEKTFHCKYHLCSKPFITASPKEILESGKINRVHVIIGLSVSDGVFYLTKQFLSPVNNEAIMNDCAPDLKHFIPDEILAKCGANATVEIETKILQKYFPESENISVSLIHLYTDVAFVLNHVVSIQLLAKYSLDVWVYKYTYTGQKDITKLTTGLQYPGPGDGDLLAYVFDVEFAGLGQMNTSAADLLSTKHLVKVLKNFLVNCDPSPVPTPLGPLIWGPTSPNGITGIDFNANSSIIVNPYADVIQFWSDLAKICSNNEIIVHTCELLETENSHHGKKCNCEIVDNGYLHKIYQLLSGNSDCKCKNHGEENIILHYLSVQISRLFK